MHLRPRHLALPVLALALAGCDALNDRPGPEAPPRDFGAAYNIVVETAAQAAEATPALDDDGVLRVRVVYRGGCGEHAFPLQHEIDDDGTAEVWLRHVAPAPCEQERTLSEALAVQVHPEVQERERVVLIAPSGNALVLRDQGDA